MTLFSFAKAKEKKSPLYNPKETVISLQINNY